MRDLVLIIVIGGLISVGYYFWQDHQNSLTLTQSHESQCEDNMKTMKFDSQQASDDYFINCLSGQIDLQQPGLHD